jgi:hypothetical protein
VLLRPHAESSLNFLGTSRITQPKHAQPAFGSGSKTNALTCSAECRRAREQTRHRDYYAANRERVRERQREYNEATRERRLAYQREYNKAHREQRRKTRENR